MFFKRKSLFYLILSIVLLGFSACFPKLKSNNDLLLALAATSTQVYTLQGQLNESGSPLQNAMLYFPEPSSGTTASSIRLQTQDSSSTSGTDSTSSTANQGEATPTGEEYMTSSSTDSEGNFTVTLKIGTYEVVVTTTKNTSHVFKIKIELDEASSNGVKATVVNEEGISVTIKVIGPAAGNPPISKAKPFVCGFNSKGDTAPPYVKKMTLTPSLQSAGDVAVSAEILEGDDGVNPISGVSEVFIRLFSPKMFSGKGGSSIYAKLSLNSETGLFEGKGKVHDYQESGKWYVSHIILKDKVGNKREYRKNSKVSVYNFAYYACGRDIDSKLPLPYVEVSGTHPDETAPTLISSELTRTDTSLVLDGPEDTVDVSSAEVSLKLSLTVDKGTGENDTDINTVEAKLISPSRYADPFDKSKPGNELKIKLSYVSDGTSSSQKKYEGTVTVNSSNENGLWLLSSVSVSDLAGNSMTYARSTDNSVFTDTSITVSKFTLSGGSAAAEVDFFPPYLKSLSVDKESVGNDSITITAELDDPSSITTTTASTDTTTTTDSSTASTTTTDTTLTLVKSGAQKVVILLYSPLKLLDNKVGSFNSITLTYNATSQKFEGSFTFTEYHEQGTWKAAVVRVYDKAGNSREYNLEDGFPSYKYNKEEIEGNSTEKADSGIAILQVSKTE
ncbi:MAG: hypothetical protein H7A25_05030 [Leptospiraceae bacterium]|nr:hypothetical protein [Leptospiraceae bacterium]MCP5499242.1 hypothetical protein [Leptospiraceae bacterium]